MSSFWKYKKVAVTGGSGFIGSHLVEMLVDQKARVTVVDRTPKSKTKFLSKVISSVNYHKVDLIAQSSRLNKAFKNQDTIFHLAARVAGIEFNRHHPATMLSDNITMTTNVLEAARITKVKRFQFVSSACVYPRHCTIPTPETEGFLDEPEPTNYGYGWAKRIGEVLTKTYSQEFGLKVSIVRPYNCYGPRDDFDPKTSHVIPALVKRVIDGQNPVTVWGNGKATRSFLYVKDFARGLMEALEKYPLADPINLGTNEEITIKDLVKLIINVSNSSAKIKFDRAKPNGQPRRNCDTRKAKKKVGFQAKVKLEQGLKETINWYRKNRV